jgi:predicted phosphoribosyltransferase
MADTLTTIITSAAVAAIVSSAAVIWNGWRERVSRVNLQQMQERRQTTLRELDRKHDLRDRDSKRLPSATSIAGMRVASRSSLICGRSEI